MNIIKNKKGAEINITTIIVIILAILVLVILALYFTGGMKSLWGKITSVKGAWDQSDIENVRTNCGSICAGGPTMKDTYCGRSFMVKTADGKNATKMFCDDSNIKAYNLDSCKEAGFDSQTCATYDRSNL